LQISKSPAYLSHVTDSETSQRRVVAKSLNTHWLGGNHLNDSGITRLDELGSIFNRFTRTTIDLLQQLGELAGDVGSVAIEDGSVTSADLTWVVEYNDLGVKGVGTLGRVVLGITSDVTTTDLLDGDVLDVEPNVVSWLTLGKLLVVHLNGLHFSGDVGGSECYYLGGRCISTWFRL